MPTRLPTRETGLCARTRHRWRPLPTTRSPEAPAPGGRGLPPPAPPGRCTASRLPPASPACRVTGRAGFPGSKGRQEAGDAVTEPARAIGETGVSAFPGEFEDDIWGDLAGPLTSFGGSQDVIGEEGIVARIEEQRRHLDVLQERPGGGARPVILDVAKAIHGRGHGVLEIAQAGGVLHASFIVGPGVALEL